jgi:hypothetical protein
MVSTLRNQRQRISRSSEIGARGGAKERSKISNILWTIDIVSCEDLQGNQMGRVGNADTHTRHQLHLLGLSDNLGLDAG